MAAPLLGPATHKDDIENHLLSFS